MSGSAESVPAPCANLGVERPRGLQGSYSFHPCVRLADNAYQGNVLALLTLRVRELHPRSGSRQASRFPAVPMR